MPVPKRRKSVSKSRMQRAANMKFTATQHGRCSECGELKLPHNICGSCGKYNGRQVIAVINKD